VMSSLLKASSDIWMGMLRLFLFVNLLSLFLFLHVRNFILNSRLINFFDFFNLSQICEQKIDFRPFCEQTKNKQIS
jgi:hypothetical protein